LFASPGCWHWADGLLCPLCPPYRSYPHSLYFLDLLQTPEFRAKIASPAYKEVVHTQQVSF
jgi:hypothetical protein